ncbi:MAG: amino acid permease [Isosphaeraceae bacterium]
MSLTKTEDIQDLARFGYRQELDRSLGSFSSFAAGFSYISILTGVFQMFYLGHAAAGPAFFWTWPVVFLGQFTVALGFAELAAHYPLSGGVYQWSRRIGSPTLGWMTGWVYLASSLVSLAAVALALQATLPQISPVFQVIGDGTSPADRARNAVLLGCVLIGLTTAINARGVRLMARINNVGVFTELVGVVLLIVLLLVRARRGPGIVFSLHGGGSASGLGWLAPLLAAAVMPSYVMYGFDTAGTLAEETKDPRRRAPWAILRALGAAGLAGGLLIIAALMAAADPAGPELGRLNGGLPAIVKASLGRELGGIFLVTVIFAISVCALAVHAGTVRLIFSMARDNSLPFARGLARITAETSTPIVPAVLTGAAAALILLLNVNLPRIIETLCSVAIVWANLAYLMVSLPLLLTRLRGSPGNVSTDMPPADRSREGRRFALGSWGLGVNLVAVCWGVFVIVNMSWPRAEIYGTDPWGKYAAVLATSVLLGLGWLCRLALRRNDGGILAEHAAGPEAAETAAVIPAWPVLVE